MKKTRLVAIILFIVMAICLIVPTVMSVANGDTPVVYRNDTKYTITEYPAKMINGTLHLPVSFFVGLQGIQYELNRDNNSFYLRNQSTGRFFSYSFNSTGIVVDNSFLNISFPIENSTVYLPLEYCADILSLKIETVVSGSIKRVRLTDGSEKLTFEELIELYDPTSPTDSPIINPDNPDNPIDPDKDTKTVYITIDVYPDTKADKFLDMLRDWGEKATFFFTKEALETNPESVLRAFGSGNGIAITSAVEKKDTLSRSLEETKNELEITNRILYDVLGFCSRLYRFPEGTSERAISSEDFFPALTEMGYIIWDYNIDADITVSSPWAEAKRIYDTIKENDVTVVRFTSHEKSLKILTQLLSFVAHNEKLTARVIDPTVSEYNFYSEIQEDR